MCASSSSRPMRNQQSGLAIELGYLVAASAHQLIAPFMETMHPAHTFRGRDVPARKPVLRQRFCQVLASSATEASSWGSISRTLPSPLDFRQLFKLRLVVAALGESQRLGWWNSGVLTGTGEFLFQQGFPAPRRSRRAGPGSGWPSWPAMRPWPSDHPRRADHLPSVPADTPAGGRLRERAQPLDGRAPGVGGLLPGGLGAERGAVAPGADRAG